MNRLFVLVGVVGCLLCLASLGCGPGGPAAGDVTGVVTLDGKPLTNSLVTFSPEAGGPASTGKTDAEGKYELYRIEGKGAVLGKHKVSVTTLQEAAAAAAMSSDSADYAKQAMGGAATDYNKAAVVERIPARYNAQTELSFEVKSGDNTANFDLKTGG